jgi:AraC family transcriptional regulator, transcriptional activator of the genes for pyochelin and ferripyochelin receptors
MIVELASYDPEYVLDMLAKHMRTKVICDHAERRLIIPEKHGTGFIAAIDFRDGLGMFVFDCELKHDITMVFKSIDYQPLRMIFCMQSYFSHSIYSDRIKYQLSSLLGSMVSGTCRNEQIFSLPAENRIFYYSIEMDRRRYRTKIEQAAGSLPEELKEVFFDMDCNKSFLYQSHYSLTIADCINKLAYSDHSGIVRRLFLESKTLEIMALKVKQYMDDKEPSQKQTILRKRDIEQIIEAKNILLKDLQNPPPVKDLARMVGINEFKLKKGFKRLYDTSVYKVVLNERLDQAKLLLAENKYSIKEIANMLGYKHTGHFTARFRERFGVLPSEFLKTIDGSES